VSLLASIHDVAPPHLAAARALREELDAAGVHRATLLVVPDFHGRHPLEGPGGRDTVRWLRERAAAGDEICLHGGTHRPRGPIAGAGARLRAALFTAGEGECLALDGAAARRLLDDGRRRLQDLVGAPVRGFVAPAWLEPPWFDEALAACGFGWHEGSLWIERLGRLGRPPLRIATPVIGFATRSAPRRAAARAWAALLAPALARAGARHPVRVALHPADLGSPSIMRAARAALRALARSHAADTYASALNLEGPHADADAHADAA
jgi:predicted deacetylase